MSQPTEPTAPMLALKRVSCRFADGRGTTTALDGVDLAVATGELVAVMGPSGSGKSTIVHVACGLVDPEAGTVSIGGQQPRRNRRAWWAEQRRTTIGVVHQRLNLVPGLDALDNVALPLLLAGRPRAAALAAARAALAEVGIADLAPAQPGALSVGEQQRVAIARAVVGPRRLVLADEPTAALDRLGGEQVVRLLATLAHAGRAVLFVTHDRDLAAWADRIVSLRDGLVVDQIGANR